MLLRLLTLGSPGRWDSRCGFNTPVARTGLGGAGMLLAGFSWKYLIVLYYLGRAVSRIDFTILGGDQISEIQLILSTESCQCQCSKVQCSLLPCSAVQCSAVQCSAVQCSAVQCSAVQCSAVQCSAVRCNWVVLESLLAVLQAPPPSEPDLGRHTIGSRDQTGQMWTR